jgi:hypothetical protein
MSQFSTIHIFGYGETQIIGQDHNGKVEGASITSQQALVDNIKSLAPEDVIMTDHHVIHIFNDTDIRYLGKGTSNRADKTNFSINVSQVDQNLLNSFISELISLVPVNP